MPSERGTKGETGEDKATKPLTGSTMAERARAGGKINPELLSDCTTFSIYSVKE